MEDKEIVAIEYLTPTDNDAFIEEDLGNDEYRVTFGKSFIRVQMKSKEDGGVSLVILENLVENSYFMKKLYGYVIFKIVVRYSDKKI